MTASVTSPSARVFGARHALLAALSCSSFWGCLGDAGELFPETASPASASPQEPVEAPSAEPRPAEGDALAEAPANGAAVVDGATPAAGGRSESEQPGPIELDPGATDEDDGSASETSAPADDGESPRGPASSDVATPPGTEGPAQATPSAASGSADVAQACAGIADPLLLDFTSPGGDPTQALFGDFRDVLSGGTYVYPAIDEGALQAPGLRSDVTSGDWHISGLVAQQAGFGLFLDCQLLDASRFTGLAFRVSGEGAGSITLLIGTASNDVSGAWLVANEVTSSPTSGRCTPAQNEYDGTCSQARIEVPVSPQAREVLVPFSALGQGRPEPGVNPAEITTIGWALPSPQVNGLGNTDAYDVDLRIDDIRFIESPAQLPEPGLLP